MNLTVDLIIGRASSNKKQLPLVPKDSLPQLVGIKLGGTSKPESPENGCGPNGKYGTGSLRPSVRVMSNNQCSLPARASLYVQIECEWPFSMRTQVGQLWPLFFSPFIITYIRTSYYKLFQTLPPVEADQIFSYPLYCYSASLVQTADYAVYVDLVKSMLGNCCSNDAEWIWRQWSNKSGIYVVHKMCLRCTVRPVLCH